MRGAVDPRAIAAADEDLGRILHLLECDHFSAMEPGAFRALIDGMLDAGDPWMTVADFRSYLDAQARAEALWADQEAWTRASIRNTAASGRCSSDRIIA